MGSKTSAEDASPVWVEIRIVADPPVHEAVCSFLFDLGCEGVVTEDFADRSVKGYLPSTSDPTDIRARVDEFLRRLQDIFPRLSGPHCSIRVLETTDWGLEWRRFFKPDQVTPSLMIVPAWEKTPEGVSSNVMRLDPGPAFGTGLHPTTRMCLRAIETVPRGRSWSMLDVGTGSGILAIYGAILGSKKVLAIDIDPEALQWAERNLGLNRAHGAVELSSTPLEGIGDVFSLVTANLLLSEMKELLPVFPGVMEPDGCLVLSGILREQVKEVRSGLSSLLRGAGEPCEMYQGEWACMIYRKGGRKAWECGVSS